MTDPQTQTLGQFNAAARDRVNQSLYQIIDPRLHTAFAPHLERHHGHTVRAVADLLTDLKFTGGDEVEFNAALATALETPRPQPAPQHRPEAYRRPDEVLQ